MASPRPPLPDFSRHLLLDRDQIARCLNLTHPREIDAVLDDLASRLTHAWIFLRDVDRNLSTAKQRTTLRTLQQNATLDADQIHGLDPSVANRIGSHLPGGPQQLLYGETSARAIMVSIRKALVELRKPARGRPSGTDRLALRQLALGIAIVWTERTGRPPTRTYDASARAERGAFHDFVVLVIKAIPLRLRKTAKGGTRAVDHIVRLAIAEYYAAIESGDPTRARGNIDERLWLGPR